MGKTFRQDPCDCFSSAANIDLVAVDDIHVSPKTVDKIMRRDKAQVEELRCSYEAGRYVVRVVLRLRYGGGYNIEDGRHRVIAAKLAHVAYIEALIINK